MIAAGMCVGCIGKEVGGSVTPRKALRGAVYEKRCDARVNYEKTVMFG